MRGRGRASQSIIPRANLAELLYPLSRHRGARRRLYRLRGHCRQREDKMYSDKYGRITRSIAATGVLSAALALQLATAQAQDKTYEMKISTPTINDTPD